MHGALNNTISQPLSPKKQRSYVGSHFMVLLALVFLFPVGYFSYLSPAIETFYTWAPLLILVAALLFMLLTRRDLLIDSALVVLVLYCVVLVSISAVSDRGSLVYALQLSCKYFSLLLLAFLIVSSEKREKLCRTCFTFFFALTALNTVTVFVFPDSMYPDSRGLAVCWLLGGDNFSVRFYILSVLFAFLMGGSGGKKWILASMINYGLFVFVRFCGMGIVSFALIVALLLTPLRFVCRWRIKLKHAIVVGLLAFVVVVVLGQMDYFSFILDLLGKDVTLSARTRIWLSTFGLLSDHWLLGYGALRGPDIEQLLMFPGMTNVHNTYLMVAMFGGVVLVVLYLAFQCVAAKQLDQYSHEDIPFALIVCCIALVLHSQIEGNYFDITLFVFTLAYYIGKGRCGFFGQIARPDQEGAQ